MSRKKKVVLICLALALALALLAVAIIAYRFYSRETPNHKAEYFETVSGKQVEMSEFSRAAVATLENNKVSVTERLFDSIGHSNFEQASVVFLPEVHCNIPNKLNVAEAISGLAKPGDVVLLESTEAGKENSGLEAFFHTVIPNLSKAYYESTDGKYDARDNIREAIISQLKGKKIEPESVWANLQAVGWDDVEASDNLRKLRVSLKATLETIAEHGEPEVLDRLKVKWMSIFGLSDVEAFRLMGALKGLLKKDNAAVSTMNQVLLRNVFHLNEKEIPYWKDFIQAPNAVDIATMILRHRALFKTIKELVKPQRKIFVTLGANHSPLMDSKRDSGFINKYYLSSTSELTTSLSLANISYVVLRDKGAPWLQGC